VVTQAHGLADHVRLQFEVATVNLILAAHKLGSREWFRMNERSVIGASCAVRRFKSLSPAALLRVRPVDSPAPALAGSIQSNVPLTVLAEVGPVHNYGPKSCAENLEGRSWRIAAITTIDHVCRSITNRYVGQFLVEDTFRIVPVFYCSIPIEVAIGRSLFVLASIRSQADHVCSIDFRIVGRGFRKRSSPGSGAVLQQSLLRMHAGNSHAATF
jgi:hypothetical protein